MHSEISLTVQKVVKCSPSVFSSVKEISLHLLFRISSCRHCQLQTVTLSFWLFPWLQACCQNVAALSTLPSSLAYKLYFKFFNLLLDTLFTSLLFFRKILKSSWLWLIAQGLFFCFFFKGTLIRFTSPHTSWCENSSCLAAHLVFYSLWLMQHN